MIDTKQLFVDLCAFLLVSKSYGQVAKLIQDAGKQAITVPDAAMNAPVNLLEKLVGLLSELEGLPQFALHVEGLPRFKVPLCIGTRGSFRILP